MDQRMGLGMTIVVDTLSVWESEEKFLNIF